MSKLNILTKGFFKENPSLILVLGTCPTLAVTTSVNNALGMGAATTFVLLMSNILISMLKNVIPDKIRIPCFIVIIATFVSMIDLIIQGFLPALSASLGVFIPLIVVNCIVLGRAEAFASKNPVFDSLLDGLGIRARGARCGLLHGLHLHSLPLQHAAVCARPRRLHRLWLCDGCRTPDPE